MLIKKHLLMVAFIFLFFICVWLHHNLNDQSASARSSEENITDQPLIEKSDILIKEIQDTLEDKGIDMVSIGLMPQSKEISVELNGTEDYLHEVKNDIENTLNKLKQETIFESYSVHIDLPTIIGPLQQKEIKKAKGITTFLYGEKGIIKQVDDELKKQGYKFQTLVKADSLDYVKVRYILNNKTATHSEQEAVKAIFFETVRNNNIDPDIFKLEVNDSDHESVDK